MADVQEQSILNRNIESVLNDVKDFCGIRQEDTDFDTTICGCIDTVMSTLCQLGVVKIGNLKPVQNDSLTWSEFIDDPVQLAMAKQYVKIKVRLMFDPPASGTIKAAYESQADEFEFRAQFAAEYPCKSENIT